MHPSVSLLVVERDRDTRSLLVRLLERAGYRVIAVSTAKAAYSALRDHTDIRLMLVDVGPRAARSVVRLASEAKRLRPDLKLLYTANLTEALLDLSDGRPLVELADEPGSIERLTKLIDTLLKQ